MEGGVVGLLSDLCGDYWVWGKVDFDVDEMTGDNNKLISTMIDDCMEIMRDCVLLEDVSEQAWEQANQVQVEANKLKHAILDLEKMVR